jgi:ATP-dependent helicase/nuclease subunit B
MSNYQICYTLLNDIASHERLQKWMEFQRANQQQIHYILPSVKWFQKARSRQSGISFKTFDDLATTLLRQRGVRFEKITESERTLLFHQLLMQDASFISEKERLQQAKAYSDTYG